jgi:hypothetical protein
MVLAAITKDIPIPTEVNSTEATIIVCAEGKATRLMKL